MVSNIKTHGHVHPILHFRLCIATIINNFFDGLKGQGFKIVMVSSKVFIIGAVILCVLQAGPPAVHGICCGQEYQNPEVGAMCDEHSHCVCGNCLRLRCCGRGPCNIFCCDCPEAGCLAGKCSANPDQDKTTPQPKFPATGDPKLIFTTMDTNEDGEVSQEEFEAYVTTYMNLTNADVPDEFRKMVGDKNFLTLEDVDKNIVEVD